MKRAALLLLILSAFCSCREEVNENPDPHNVFESLWTILDEKYCFFEVKNIDWNDIHDEFSHRVDTCTNSVSLFKILGEMVFRLQDGHVNLYAAQDIARYWKWFEDYPPNFDESLERNYLSSDYQIASGLKYKMLNDSIGYITYRSFSAPIGEAGLDYILNYFKNTPGIILDIRDNSGGDLSNVEILASRFTEKRIISGYIRHKTGPGHSDFSKPYPIYLNPSPRKRYSKKVVILTNRLCYSATNAFVSTMNQLPNVTVMGDRTGGGSGFPINAKLPNGWSVRFSSCPTYNANMELTEAGIDPDITASLLDSDRMKGVDTIIETARSFILKKP